jgi:hypothetical protein
MGGGGRLARKVKLLPLPFSALTVELVTLPTVNLTERLKPSSCWEIKNQKLIDNSY